MNLALLITFMFTLALAQATYYQPCQHKTNNNAYNTFVRQHIVQGRFNRKSKTDWETYLHQNHLCHRPTQSFIESHKQAHIVRICKGGGFQVVNGGNLCISWKRFKVYQLSVNTYTCKVNSLARNHQQVVVACDKVANQCLPVHYEGFNGQKPNKKLKCR